MALVAVKVAVREGIELSANSTLRSTSHVVYTTKDGLELRARALELRGKSRK